MWTNLTFSADMSTFPQLKGSFFYNAFFGKRFNNFGIFSLEFCSYHPWISVIIAHLHYMRNIRIRSYSGPHFFRIFPHLDWIWRDTPHLSVFSPNAGKCGKNADQNNSEYGHFLRSANCGSYRRRLLTSSSSVHRRWSMTLDYDNDLFCIQPDYMLSC